MLLPGVGSVLGDSMVPIQRILAFVAGLMF
jgi:hypothetical protein